MVSRNSFSGFRLGGRMGVLPEIALWVLLGAACATDLLWGKIYNWLTLPFLLSGLIYQSIDSGLAGSLNSTLAIALAFALFFPLYALKVVAAGDAKLLMALASWTNSATTLRVAAIAILVGAAVGAVALVAEKGVRGSSKSILANLRSHEPTAASLKMAFGPALLCAYAIVLVAHLRQWEWV
jgi:prepilin peptidase CpaA